MQWRSSPYFWLLLAVVAVEVVLVVALRRRREHLRAFADAGLVPRLTPDVDPRRRQLRAALRLVTLMLLVFALAGPKWGFHWEEVRRQGIDLIVAIDTSRSMLATDVKPNRLERAKLAVLDLVKLMEGDRVALVPFAGSAFLECPLTLDRAAFERSLRSLHAGIIPRGGTALARAIDTSLEGFEARQGKYEVLILITDGEDHEGEVEEAAKRAAERGVKIYTVGIGTSEGELIPAGEGGYLKDRQGQVVKSRLNEEVLQQIAIITGGAYVRGTGASLGLDEVFREHISKMERREVSSTLERRYEDRFQIPLALALIVLLAETVTGERKRAPLRRWRWWPRRARTVEQISTTAFLLLLMPLLVGWIDPPGDRAAEGNRLYAAGKYAEAAEKYGEGLVDAPRSPLLHFNRGAALYKQGKYAEAIEAWTKVAASGEEEWIGRAAYNLGNAQYQLGANAEQGDPPAAIASYEQALTSYKRAMAADPSDEAPKFNHELVEHRLRELKKKLEEEKKRQEEERQEGQEQQGQEQQGQGQHDPSAQQQEQASQEPQHPNEAEQQREGEGQEQAAQSRPEESDEQEQAHLKEQQGAAGGPAAGGEPERDLEREAARAVIDVARDEELGPEDVQRPVGVADVLEPAKDW